MLWLRASALFESGATMQILNPTPSCTRFDETEVVCGECGRQMRLVLSEPYKLDSALELRTFQCAACGHGESYLMHL
jgi:ribosomal protein L37E